MSTPLPTKLKGTVTQFKGDGRRLGYPTANLMIETDLKDGVYFGYADLAEWKGQPTVIFIGVPTTMGESQRRVEAHLLDIPDQDYYGLLLSLTVAHFYRDNQTFDSVEALRDVMKNDEQAARQWFTTQATSS